MPEYLSNLVCDKTELLTIYRQRSKTYVEKKVKGKTLELAKEKAEIEKKEGWTILPKKFKNSVRLRKPKPVDIALEDEIWSLLFQMGFDEYGRGRNLKVFIDDETPARQIDVFAKDDETALLVECTCCEERKEKNLNDLLEKIISISKEAFTSINKHYHPAAKLKIRWIIATRNIEWRKADLTKAEANNIVVLKDEELDYYKKMTKHIKTAAKYQLLAHVFSQEKIHALDLQVPATRGKMGGLSFFNFLIKPLDLLKISFISHKQSRNIEDFETYQRMLEPKRLEKIAKYVDAGGQFPTNIVINIKTDRKLRFDKIQEIGDSSYGTLYLPNHYASAWVIDGQHRLYGYVYSKRSEKGKEDKTTFPVLAYENLPQANEAKLFVDINCEQVRVKRSLLNEIYAGLKWDSKDFTEKLDALCSRTVMKLNTTSKSPFYERITVSNTQKTYYRCLTLTSFVDGLKENKFFGDHKTVFKPGLLYASYDEDLGETLDKATEILIHYFNLIRSSLLDHWMLGDQLGGFLSTNNGVRCLLRVLKEILLYIQDDIKNDLDDLPAETINEYLSKYAGVIIKHFSSCSPETIQRFRSRQALAGVSQNAIELMSFIHQDIPAFCPLKLQEYLDTIDEKGTQEARELIDQVQITMFKYVTGKLKEQHGEDWWYDGIPEKVRTGCSDRHEKEKGIKNKEQYLTIIDYQSIAHENWGLFEKIFSMSKDGGKEKKLKWVAELSVIRNITHHVEKWPATKEQVKFVRDVHQFVMGNFVL
ncbi:MAG: DGQHR domain-containing protein [Deltaproteobacteria bacterium]|nr:DGQHR domain-containing protein [Deltaproteobacteria bacterium]